MTATNSKDGAILVIGAGVFGLSTALELSKRSYTNVTILDRYLPPVPDGSSVDISRVIRMDYADPVYGGMANEALQKWKTEYSDFYRDCGFVLVAQTPRHPYIQKCKEVLRGLKQNVVHIDEASTPEVPNNRVDLTGLSGFYNPIAGWADAEGAISYLAKQCSLAGVSFVTGASGTVVSLVTQRTGSGVTVTGVKVRSGETIRASRVILATGAWSSRILDISGSAVSTSQPVAFMQLSPAEADELRNHPIVMNLTTGVFCFPPTDSNVLKLAQHGHGFETRYNANWSHASESAKADFRVSTPPLQPSSSGYLPADADDALRKGLKLMFPQFAGRPWSRQRMCWYTDTPQGDFIVDHHPRIDQLFLATGGSGQ